MTGPTYRRLLDILVEHVGAPLPEGCDAWGIRTVHADFTSSHDFRWPFPGGEAVAPGPILEHRESCPRREGDGICTGLTARGMASAGVPAVTVLLTAHATADVIGDSEPGKLRLTRAHVVEVLDLPKIARGGHLRWANLREADLTWADLRRADLSEADLSGADLGQADLRRANLFGADLGRANLSGADLGQANLREADLRRANLRRADLSEANLSGADLSEADLRWADLSGANLGQADLTWANLSWANLGGWERGVDGYARHRTTPAAGTQVEGDIDGEVSS